jgi:hypothetical protein
MKELREKGGQRRRLLAGERFVLSGSSQFLDPTAL